IDKLDISRNKALAMVAVPGIIGSVCFALPTIIDPGLSGNGTLGLTLLDLLDHWAFNYSLLTVSFLECIMLGWVLGAKKLRQAINENSVFTLVGWFDVQIKFVIPALLGIVLVWNLMNEFNGDLYGTNYVLGGLDWLPYVIPVIWFVSTLIIAAYLTYARSYGSKEKSVAQPEH